MRKSGLRCSGTCVGLGPAYSVRHPDLSTSFRQLEFEFAPLRLVHIAELRREAFQSFNKLLQESL